MQSHLERGCPERQVECKHCKQTMTARALGEQPMFACASDDQYKSAWTGHLAECAHAKVRCAFWSIGCRDPIKRSEMAAHNATDASAHASLTVQKLASMEAGNKRQLQKLREDMQWEQMAMSWRVPTLGLTAGSTTRQVVRSTGPLVAGNRMCVPQHHSGDATARAIRIQLVMSHSDAHTHSLCLSLSLSVSLCRRRYLRLDVAAGDEGELKVNLCTERPPWSPVRVREVSIYVEDRPNSWAFAGNSYKGQPRFDAQAASLQSPGYSCGGPLEYTYEPESDGSESDADLEVTSDRQLNRADLEEISDGSGYIKLRASFQVKKVTSVNVKSAA